MSLVAVASVRGAPGATTLAVALAGLGVRASPALLVEADPQGGVLAARHGLAPEPGLATLAAAARHGRSEVDPRDHARELGPCRHAVLAPVCGERTRVALHAAGRIAERLRSLPGVDVVVDTGRLDIEARGELVGEADRLVVVVRPLLEEIAALASLLERLRSSLPPLSLALAGDRPYPPHEVAKTLDVDVAGVLPHDRRAVRLLERRDAGEAALRTRPLGRAVSRLAGVLVRRLEQSGQPDAGHEQQAREAAEATT